MKTDISEDSSHPNGSIDRLLKRFFESEMPHPWPAWQGPGAGPLTGTVGRSSGGLARSRFSLAVAASLLVGLAALLSALPHSRSAPAGPRPEGGLIEAGTAKIPKELLKEKK